MKAYVTLLSNKSYLPGVIALQRALRKSKTIYPLYCMLSVSVDKETEENLQKEGVGCLRLQSTATDNKTNQESLNKSHWNNTFDKLFAWGLTQFEKIVFLDCDLLIVQNIDHLFQNETFSAVLADSSYPGNEYWRENSGVMVLVPNKEIEKGCYSLSL